MKEELRCPKCNSSQTRYRVKTKDRMCYSCGHIYDIISEKLEEETNGNN